MFHLKLSSNLKFVSLSFCEHLLGSSRHRYPLRQRYPRLSTIYLLDTNYLATFVIKHTELRSWRRGRLSQARIESCRRFLRSFNSNRLFLVSSSSEAIFKVKSSSMQ